MGYRQKGQNRKKDIVGLWGGGCTRELPAQDPLQCGATGDWGFGGVYGYCRVYMYGHLEMGWVRGRVWSEGTRGGGRHWNDGVGRTYL